MLGHGVPRVSGTAAEDKSDAAKAREQQQIAAYRELEADVRQRIKAKDYSNDTLQQTSRLLSRNPEYYTIWNDRRRILQNVFTRELATATDDPDPDPDPNTPTPDSNLTRAQHEISLLISEDLTFLLPLLKAFPKCYSLWHHRSWLLGAATRHLPASSAATLWRGELALIGKMLAQDSRNFHGWGYRREVVGQLGALSGSGSGSGSGSEETLALAEAELAYTTAMVRSGLSNFSAWHYRAQLLPEVLGARGAGAEERRKVFAAELEMVTQALWTDSYPYDQSVWFYHQFLMATLDEGNARAGRIVEPCEDEERMGYLAGEIGGLKEMVEGAEDNKYIYQALLEYSRMYRRLGGVDEGVVALAEMKGWLETLRKLDPLRAGRWADLEAKLDV